MIRFAEIQETDIPSFYGGNGVTSAKMTADELNRIMQGRLHAGASIGLHKHETSSEIIFILSGRAQTICDGVTEELGVGDCHYCKKGSVHALRNCGTDDLVFYAVVPQQ